MSSEKAISPGRSFSENIISGCFGPDQVYYKYKTDYWRKGGGFPTPTGKLELYSTVLEKMGYDPLPYFKEPGESPISTPELAKEYPLVLDHRFPFAVLFPGPVPEYSLVTQLHGISYHAD